MGSRKTSKVRQARLGGCLAFVFFGAFAAAGLGAFYFVTFRPIADILAARSWEETTCRIVSSEVAESRGSDSTTYRVDIRYTYEAEWGETYRGDRYDFSIGSSSGYDAKARVVEAHPPGSEVTCWVDPEEPSRAVIDRSPGGFLWWGLFPLPFLAVGVGGLAYLASPAGRRTRSRVPGRPAAREAGASRRAPATRDAAARAPLPRRGPLELEAEVSPAFKLVGVLVMALLWNGMVSLFVLSVILPSFRHGDPEWFATVFMIPFALVGIALLAASLYQLLASFNPRPHLTLADGHLRPGSASSLRWQFGGRAGRVEKLTLRLEGRETARYRRGTSTVTDHHVFHASELASEGRFGTIHRGNATLEIPSRTMPTFTADNNKIEWRVVVHGEVAFWPDVHESFAVTVYPS